MDPATGLLLIRASSGDVRVAFGGMDFSRDLLPSFEVLYLSFLERGERNGICV